LKVPIAFIVGDCEGNDRLCGRYGTHNLGNALVCRDCDCSTDDADDPLIICEPLTLEMFDVDNDDPDTLSHLSHHNIDNAFHKACFGGDKEGVHGCTPPEMLHLYQQGLYKYALEAFVDAMTSEQKRGLDQLISIVSNNCCRQSDRTFPRFRFPKGITNLSCFTASEQVGVVLVCLLAISMKRFESAVLCFDASRRSYVVDHELFDQCHQFATLFESMLTAEAWMNKSKHNKEEVTSVAPEKIASLMESYKTIVNRTEGNGLKLPKFHQLKHLPRYILKFGVPNNFSTSRCESHHIHLSKRPASTAQKRDECFETQVGKRIVDSVVVDRASQTLLPASLPTDPVAKQIGGTRFSIVRLESGNHYSAVPFSGKSTGLPFEQHLLDAFATAFSGYFPSADGIPCFTEHKRKDSNTDRMFVFRGHPMFRGKNWNDWAYFKWNSNDDNSSLSEQSVEAADETEDVPGRILFFVDARGMTNHPEYSPGLYAVIQSMTKKPTSCGRHSFMLRGSVNPKITFYLCHVDSIVDVAFVLPNVGMPNEYFVLRPPQHWPDLFIQ